MRRCLLAAAVLGAVLALAGCSPDAGPAGQRSEPPLPTLPAGALAPKVLQPGDVQRGLVPIAAQTGPADLKKIASFSADPAAAEKSLRDHGFQDAYVVQYASPDTRGVVTNVVVAFATEQGARDDLAADLAATVGSGEPVAVDGLGDQAGGVRTALDPQAKTGDLVTLRWRVGNFTYLLAVGAPTEVADAPVRELADLLTARARGATPTPAPAPTAVPTTAPTPTS